MSKAVDSAVSFAASMMRKGEYMGRAVRVAAGYYKVPYEEVQKGLAARSGRSQAGKKRTTTKPFRKCQICGERWAVWKATVRWGYHNCGSSYSCEVCGKQLDPAYESEEGLTVKWTAYKPTAAKPEC